MFIDHAFLGDHSTSGDFIDHSTSGGFPFFCHRCFHPGFFFTKLIVNRRERRTKQLGPISNTQPSPGAQQWRKYKVKTAKKGEKSEKSEILEQI